MCIRFVMRQWWDHSLGWCWMFRHNHPCRPHTTYDLSRWVMLLWGKVVQRWRRNIQVKTYLWISKRSYVCQTLLFWLSFAFSQAPCKNTTEGLLIPFKPKNRKNVFALFLLRFMMLRDAYNATIISFCTIRRFIWTINHTLQELVELQTFIFLLKNRGKWM